ncbi:MAG: PilZ domain-containing protein [Magnetococcales bacterium]|nr:PilZ domain-containing protein [Magnetococcales bacterium]
MASSEMTSQQRNFFRMPCWLSIRWRELDGQAQQTAEAFFAKTGTLPFQQEIGLERAVLSGSLPETLLQERSGATYTVVEDVRGDISGGGLSFFQLHAALQKGAVLALRFVIMGAHLPELVCLARVVRVRMASREDRQQDRQHIFCEFMSIAAHDQDHLIQYITQAQHNLLRSQSSKRISWGELTRASRATREHARNATALAAEKGTGAEKKTTPGQRQNGRTPGKLAGVLRRMTRVKSVLPIRGSFFGERISGKEVRLPGWHMDEGGDDQPLNLPNSPAWGEESVTEESFTPDTHSVEVTLPFYWEGITPGLLEWIRECLAQDGRFPDARSLPSRVQARELFTAHAKTLSQTDTRLSRLMAALRLLMEAVSARGVIVEGEDPFLSIIGRLDTLVLAMVGQDAEATTACCRLFQSHLHLLQQILDPRRQARVKDVEQKMRQIRKEMASCQALQRRKERVQVRKQIQKLGEDLDALVKLVIRQDMVTLLGYVMTPVTIQMGQGEGAVVNFLVPAPPPVVDDILRLHFAIPEDPWYWLACVGTVAAVTVDTEEGTWYSVWCRITVIQTEDQERLWHLVSDRLPGV